MTVQAQSVKPDLFYAVCSVVQAALGAVCDLLISLQANVCVIFFACFVQTVLFPPLFYVSPTFMLCFFCMPYRICMFLQAAKEAGRTLQLMKLCNNLGAVQRKMMDKPDAAYAVYQVSPSAL